MASAAGAAGWICPGCKRRFRRQRQAHSCQVVSLDAHLDRATPAARAAFHAILAALRAQGPLDVVPTRSGINLLSGTSLGSMAFRKDGVELGLLLTRKLEHPRVRGVLQLSPRSFHHRFRIGAAREVDPELTGWLAEAHAVGRMAGRRLR